MLGRFLAIPRIRAPTTETVVLAPKAVMLEEDSMLPFQAADMYPYAFGMSFFK